MKQIGIIGCGWLGTPLAYKLISLGHSIVGTSRSEAKISLLESKGIHAISLDLPSTLLDESYIPLWKCNTLFINIPPGRRNPDILLDYCKTITQILTEVSKHNENARIVFISSTGVYSNTLDYVNESAPVTGEKPSGKALIQAENIVKQSFRNHTILRLAGLVGPKREPGKWFAGKVDIPGGDTPINMVHLEDCIALCTKVILTEEIKGVYNVCADEHPTKEKFYTQMSQNIQLPIPKFQSGIIPFKIVENNLLKEKLNYLYSYPDPMNF